MTVAERTARPCVLMIAWLAVAASSPLPQGVPRLKSSPDMGKAEGACRRNESGPALVILATGLRDRRGWLKVEVYPPNDEDFLQDDKILVAEGKVFRRTEIAVPQSGTAELCVRVPAPGPYAVSLLHDRDQNHKFNPLVDGVGFAGNPTLGWSKPKAAKSEVVAGAGITRLEILLNYHRGWLSFGPVKH